MFVIPKSMKSNLKQQQSQAALSKKVSTPTNFIMSAAPRSRSQAPMAMEEYLNYGTGPAKKFYTLGGAGTMSMSPLATTDSLVSKLGQDLMSLGARYADGGKVTMSPNALKSIKQALTHLQNKDRDRAIAALRASREALNNPSVGRSVEEILGSNDASAMARLQQMTGGMQMADGGEVPTEEGAMQMGDADPQALFQEYQQLMAQLESGQLDEQQELMVIQRLQELEQALEAMGIDVSALSGEQGQPEPEQGPDIQGMLQQLQQGAGSLGVT